MTKSYIIDENEANQRLDIYLSNIFPDLSRSYIQKQIKNGNVLVHNKPVKSSFILKLDDEVMVNFDEVQKYSIEPQDIKLEILYEDDKMLVVNKPSGMLTHPTSIEKKDTLVNALLFKYPNNLSTCNGDNRPGIVHRLDRNTSGLLMIAKDNDTYNFLKSKIQERSIEKKYYAVVTGNLKDDSGSIVTDIGRHPTKPEKMAVVSSGKPSVTHFNVLERFNGYTLLDINLETGRTHQIRVHMAHIGHPIVNDTLYGGKKLPVKTNEQVLQAYSLKFTSPNDDIERTISIDYDNDIIKTLNYLRGIK